MRDTMRAQAATPDSHATRKAQRRDATSPRPDRPRRAQNTNAFFSIPKPPKRFGAPFRGPAIPFGCLVSYLPITDEDKARAHKFSDKRLRGLFIGYHTFAGGGWGSDDLELIDVYELHQAESRSNVYTKRFKWQEIIVETDVHGKFKYPAQAKNFEQPEGKENRFPLYDSGEDDEELDILDLSLIHI